MINLPHSLNPPIHNDLAYCAPRFVGRGTGIDPTDNLGNAKRFGEGFRLGLGFWVLVCFLTPKYIEKYYKIL